MYITYYYKIYYITYYKLYLNYNFSMKKCHKTASTSLPEDEHLVVRSISRTI